MKLLSEPGFTGFQDCQDKTGWYKTDARKILCFGMYYWRGFSADLRHNCAKRRVAIRNRAYAPSEYNLQTGHTQPRRYRQTLHGTRNLSRDGASRCGMAGTSRTRTRRDAECPRRATETQRRRCRSGYRCRHGLYRSAYLPENR